MMGQYRFLTSLEARTLVEVDSGNATDLAGFLKARDANRHRQQADH
jgi:hypothetical protein